MAAPGRSARAAELSRQERHRQPVEQIGGVPRHQVLAAFGEVEVELRIALLEQRGALGGAGAILAAVDQEQRHLELGEALPERHALLVLATAVTRLRVALDELLEAAADAVLVAQLQLLGRDQLVVE